MSVKVLIRKGHLEVCPHSTVLPEGRADSSRANGPLWHFFAHNWFLCGVTFQQHTATLELSVVIADLHIQTRKSLTAKRQICE